MVYDVYLCKKPGFSLYDIRVSVVAESPLLAGFQVMSQFRLQRAAVLVVFVGGTSTCVLEAYDIDLSEKEGCDDW